MNKNEDSQLIHFSRMYNCKWSGRLLAIATNETAVAPQCWATRNPVNTSTWSTQSWRELTYQAAGVV